MALIPQDIYEKALRQGVVISTVGSPAEFDTLSVKPAQIIVTLNEKIKMYDDGTYLGKRPLLCLYGYQGSQMVMKRYVILSENGVGRFKLMRFHGLLKNFIKILGEK